MAVRLLLSHLHALTALLAAGATPLALLQPALLLSLTTLSALAPGSPLLFRPAAIAATADVLSIIECLGDATARGSGRCGGAGAADVATLLQCASDALATCLRLCAFARWPPRTEAAAGGSGGGGNAPYSSHLSPFLHKLLLLLDGDATLVMTVTTGAPYAAPPASAVAHMLASQAPDYAALLGAAGSTGGAAGDAASAGADAAAAAASAAPRSDAAVVAQLAARMQAVLGAMTALLRPSLAGVERLTEDAVAFFGLSAPTAVPVPALLASLSGLCDMESLRRVGLPGAQAEGVLREALALLQALYEQAGQALRRFRSHLVGLHASLLRQPLAGGAGASPLAAARFQLLGCWLRSAGPGLPAPDSLHLLRAYVLQACAALGGWCTQGTAGAATSSGAGRVAGPPASAAAVSLDVACAAAACLQDVVAAAWFHLPDSLRLTLERTLLAVLEAGTTDTAALHAAARAFQLLREAPAESGRAGAAGDGVSAGGAELDAVAAGLVHGAARDAEGGGGEDSDGEGEEEEEDESELKLDGPERLFKTGRYYKGAAGRFLQKVASTAGAAGHAGHNAGAVAAAGPSGSSSSGAAAEPFAKRARREGSGAGTGPAGADASGAESFAGSALLHGWDSSAALGSALASCLHSAAVDACKPVALLCTKTRSVLAGPGADATLPALVALPPRLMAALVQAAATCSTAPWRGGATSPLLLKLRHFLSDRRLGLSTLALPSVSVYAPASAAPHVTLHALLGATLTPAALAGLEAEEVLPLLPTAACGGADGIAHSAAAAPAAHSAGSAAPAAASMAVDSREGERLPSDASVASADNGTHGSSGVPAAGAAAAGSAAAGLLHSAVPHPTAQPALPMSDFTSSMAPLAQPQTGPVLGAGAGPAAAGDSGGGDDEFPDIVY
jgi:hypothetical protein